MNPKRNYPLMVSLCNMESTLALSPKGSKATGESFITTTTELQPPEQVLPTRSLRSPLGCVISISDAFWPTIVHDTVHF